MSKLTYPLLFLGKMNQYEKLVVLVVLLIGPIILENKIMKFNLL